ncbi:MAG: D-alanyl-D-alanine carboxypeptidase family protein [Pseudomonadota bacterium]
MTVPSILAGAVALLCAPGLVGGLAEAKPHLVLDMSNGRVIDHRQAHDPWHPASLTKLMTAYSALKAVERGEIALTSPVRISRNAKKQPPSRMGYSVGTTLTLDNALKLLLVKSANDVSVAIAETVSGSAKAFAQQMTADARALGMGRSRFENPHGLHHPRQVTTAHDMARLILALQRDFPRLQRMFEAASLTAPKRNKEGKIVRRTYRSFNLLLERFAGADGFKTGFVCASGYNFIGSATRSGRRIAAIVLGRDGQRSRAVDAAKFISEGFQQPVGAGAPLDDVKPGPDTRSSPVNLRPNMCSEKAWAERYNPAAGQAVIESPWLQPRQFKETTLRVTLGGTSGPTNAKKRSGSGTVRLRRVPVPTFRPDGREAALKPASQRVISARVSQ